jgi:hypothetical protein
MNVELHESPSDLVAIRCKECRSDNVEQLLWVRYVVGSDTYEMEMPEEDSIKNTTWCNSCGKHTDLEEF